MYLNLNPRTMGMNRYSFNEVLEAAVRSGFQGIEVPAHAFGSIEKAKEQGKRLRDMGMQWGLMMAPCDMFLVGEEEFSSALAQWARWLERAKAAGCSRAYNHIWPGSDEKTYEENFIWHHNRLKRIYHIMKENGIQYGLEYQGLSTIYHTFRYPFIDSLAGAMALADSVNREIGFVFDGIHWYTSRKGENEFYLFLQNIKRVVNLHLDDVCINPSSSTHIFKERAMPNENKIIDSTFIVKKFYEYGYDGPVIVEPMSPTTERFEKMGPYQAAMEAALCLKQICKEAGVFI